MPRPHPQHDQVALNWKRAQELRRKIDWLQEQVYRLSEKNDRLKNELLKKEEVLMKQQLCAQQKTERL